MAVIGEVVVLVAVKLEILPIPFAAIPIAVFVFIQLKVAPGVELVKLAAGTVPPLHTTIFAGTVTVGVGLTVTVTVEAPVQPEAVPVTE